MKNNNSRNRESTSTQGYYKRLIGGRVYYCAKIIVDGKLHMLGNYKTEKEAGMAYDLYIVKNNIDRKTNYLRKANDINKFA